MPFAAPDINLVTSNYNATNLITYDDLFSNNFVAGKTYVLILTGEENAAADPNNAIAVPSTPTIAWSPITTRTKTFSAIAAFSTKVSSNTTQATSVAFPGLQNSAGWCLIEFDNTSDVITNIATTTWQAQSGSLTIGAISTDGMALLFVAPANSTTRPFDVGLGQIAITPTSGRAVFAQYNLDGTATMPVGSPQGNHYMAIGMELSFAATAMLGITSVNGGDSIADGDTGVAILGTNFVDGNNTVTISPQDDINALGAKVQTITAQSSTSLDITVDLPDGSSDQDPVYIFVDNGTEVTPAYSLSVTPLVSSEFTLVFYKSGTTDPAVCMSSDFSLGITAYKNYNDPVNESVALSIEAIDTLDTATPKYRVTFQDGAPVPLVDTVHFEYDELIGDIKTVVGSVAFPSGVYLGEIC